MFVEVNTKMRVSYILVSGCGYNPRIGKIKSPHPAEAGWGRLAGRVKGVKVPPSAGVGYLDSASMIESSFLSIASIRSRMSD